MDNKFKVIQWAHENYDDFLVVCGLKNSGTQCNIRIWQALCEAGFDELSEMMALRVFQLLFEDDPASVQAEKEAVEEFKRQQKQRE